MNAENAENAGNRTHGASSARRRPCADQRIERLAAWFESMTPSHLARLGEAYAVEAIFKDPFNEAVGLDAVRGVYEHMYASLHEPHFVVHEIVAQGDQCFFVWDFRFRFKRFSDAWQTVRGSSHLVLTPEGLIQRHRDYWDVAEELYEKLPVVGGLMRWLKQRARS